MPNPFLADPIDQLLQSPEWQAASLEKKKKLRQEYLDARKARNDGKGYSEALHRLSAEIDHAASAETVNQGAGGTLASIVDAIANNPFIPGNIIPGLMPKEFNDFRADLAGQFVTGAANLVAGAANAAMNNPFNPLPHIPGVKHAADKTGSAMLEWTDDLWRDFRAARPRLAGIDRQLAEREAAGSKYPGWNYLFDGDVPVLDRLKFLGDFGAENAAQIIPAVGVGAKLAGAGRLAQMAGVMGTAGAVGGAMNHGEAARTFDQIPQSMIEASPIYKELVAGGMSPADARLDIKQRMANTAGLIGAIANGTVGSVGELALAGALPKLFGHGLMRQFVYATVGDTAGEYVTGYIEEAGKIMGEGRAGVDAQPGVDAQTRMEKSAAEEALASLLPGFAGGVRHAYEYRDPPAPPGGTTTPPPGGTTTPPPGGTTTPPPGGTTTPPPGGTTTPPPGGTTTPPPGGTTTPPPGGTTTPPPGPGVTPDYTFDPSTNQVTRTETVPGAKPGQWREDKQVYTRTAGGGWTYINADGEPRAVKDGRLRVRLDAAADPNVVVFEDKIFRPNTKSEWRFKDVDGKVKPAKWAYTNDEGETYPFRDAKKSAVVDELATQKRLLASAASPAQSSSPGAPAAETQPDHGVQRSQVTNMPSRVTAEEARLLARWLLQPQADPSSVAPPTAEEARLLARWLQPVPPSRVTAEEARLLARWLQPVPPSRVTAEEARGRLDRAAQDPAVQSQPVPPPIESAPRAEQSGGNPPRNKPLLDTRPAIEPRPGRHPVIGPLREHARAELSRLDAEAKAALESGDEAALRRLGEEWYKLVERYVPLYRESMDHYISDNARELGETQVARTAEYVAFSVLRDGFRGQDDTALAKAIDAYENLLISDLRRQASEATNEYGNLGTTERRKTTGPAPDSGREAGGGRALAAGPDQAAAGAGPAENNGRSQENASLESAGRLGEGGSPGLPGAAPGAVAPAAGRPLDGPGGGRAGAGPEPDAGVGVLGAESSDRAVDGGLPPETGGAAQGSSQGLRPTSEARRSNSLLEDIKNSLQDQVALFGSLGEYFVLQGRRITEKGVRAAHGPLVGLRNADERYWSPREEWRDFLSNELLQNKAALNRLRRKSLVDTFKYGYATEVNKRQGLAAPGREAYPGLQALDLAINQWNSRLAEYFAAHPRGADYSTERFKLAVRNQFCALGLIYSERLVHLNADATVAAAEIVASALGTDPRALMSVITLHPLNPAARLLGVGGATNPWQYAIGVNTGGMLLGRAYDTVLFHEILHALNFILVNQVTTGGLSMDHPATKLLYEMGALTGADRDWGSTLDVWLAPFSKEETRPADGRTQYSFTSRALGAYLRRPTERLSWLADLYMIDEQLRQAPRKSNFGEAVDKQLWQASNLHDLLASPENRALLAKLTGWGGKQDVKISGGADAGTAGASRAGARRTGRDDSEFTARDMGKSDAGAGSPYTGADGARGGAGGGTRGDRASGGSAPGSVARRAPSTGNVSPRQEGGTALGTTRPLSSWEAFPEEWRQELQQKKRALLDATNRHDIAKHTGQDAATIWEKDLKPLLRDYVKTVVDILAAMPRQADYSRKDLVRDLTAQLTAYGFEQEYARRNAALAVPLLEKVASLISNADPRALLSLIQVRPHSDMASSAWKQNSYGTFNPCTGDMYLTPTTQFAGKDWIIFHELIHVAQYYLTYATSDETVETDAAVEAMLERLGRLADGDRDWGDLVSWEDLIADNERLPQDGRPFALGDPFVEYLATPSERLTHLVELYIIKEKERAGGELSVYERQVIEFVHDFSNIGDTLETPGVREFLAELLDVAGGTLYEADIRPAKGTTDRDAGPSDQTPRPRDNGGNDSQYVEVNRASRKRRGTDTPAPPREAERRAPISGELRYRENRHPDKKLAEAQPQVLTDAAGQQYAKIDGGWWRLSSGSSRKYGDGKGPLSNSVTVQKLEEALAKLGPPPSTPTEATPATPAETPTPLQEPAPPPVQEPATPVWDPEAVAYIHQDKEYTYDLGTDRWLDGDENPAPAELTKALDQARADRLAADPVAAAEEAQAKALFKELLPGEKLKKDLKNPDQPVTSSTITKALTGEPEARGALEAEADPELAGLAGRGNEPLDAAALNTLTEPEAETPGYDGSTPPELPNPETTPVPPEVAEADAVREAETFEGAKELTAEANEELTETPEETIPGYRYNADGTVLQLHSQKVYTPSGNGGWLNENKLPIKNKELIKELNRAERVGKKKLAARKPAEPEPSPVETKISEEMQAALDETAKRLEEALRQTETEAPKQETPKQETPKQETPKQETPKQETAAEKPEKLWTDIKKRLAEMRETLKPEAERVLTFLQEAAEAGLEAARAPRGRRKPHLDLARRRLAQAARAAPPLAFEAGVATTSHITDLLRRLTDYAEVEGPDAARKAFERARPFKDYVTNARRWRKRGVWLRKTFVDKAADFYEWLYQMDPMIGAEQEEHPLRQAFTEMAARNYAAATELNDRYVTPVMSFVVETAERTGRPVQEIAQELGLWAAGRHVVEEGSAELRRRLEEKVEEARNLPEDVEDRDWQLADAEKALKDYDRAQAGEKDDEGLPIAGLAGGHTDAEWAAIMTRLEGAEGWTAEDLKRGADLIVEAYRGLTEARLEAESLSREIADVWPKYKFYVSLATEGSPVEIGRDEDGGVVFNPSRDYRREGSRHETAPATENLIRYLSRAALEIGSVEFKDRLAELYSKLKAAGDTGLLVRLDLETIQKGRRAKDSRTRDYYNRVYSEPGFIRWEKVMRKDGAEEWHGFKYTFQARPNASAEAKAEAQTLRESLTGPAGIGRRFGLRGGQGFWGNWKQVDSAMKGIGALAESFTYLSRVRGQMWTKFRLMFPPIMFGRDVMERWFNLQGRRFLDDEGNNIAGSRVAALMVPLLRDREIYRTVFDAARRKEPSGIYAEYWREFKTGGADYTISKIIKLLQDPTFEQLAKRLEREKGWQKHPRQAEALLEKYLEGFDAAAPFIQYVAARKAGASQRSALSKTIDLANFYASGTATPWLSTLTPFVKATFQGGANFFRSMGFHENRNQPGEKEAAHEIHKKFLYATLGGLFLSMALAALAGDDDDTDLPIYDSVPLDRLTRYVPIQLPGMEGQLKLSLGYGAPSVAWTLANGLRRLGNDTAEPDEVLFALAVSLMESTMPGNIPAYPAGQNPGAWLMQLVTGGSPMKSFVEGAVNTDQYGRAIHTAYPHPETPNALSGFAYTPDVWKELAQKLPVDVYPETLRHVANEHLLGPFQGLIGWLESDTLMKDPAFQSTRDTLGPLATLLGASAAYSAKMNLAQSFYHKRKEELQAEIRGAGVKTTGGGQDSEAFITRNMKEAGFEDVVIANYLLIRTTDRELQKIDKAFKDDLEEIRKGPHVAEKAKARAVDWSDARHKTLTAAVKAMPKKVKPRWKSRRAEFDRALNAGELGI